MPSLHRLFTTPWASLAALAIVSGTLIACGGGGSSDSAQTQSTATSFASGPISGFGSVIINGVRFDDSKARISDDDGAAHSRGELKLGMVAAASAGPITSDDKGRHGEASSIEFHSELVGPVSAIDATAKTLTVLGQTVDVTATTVFDDRLATGFAGIKTGDVVEVYGLLDSATGHFTATRIEPKAATAIVKIRGIVANLDTAARTFTIGTETISYATLATNLVPSTLANGLLVRVKAQAVLVAGALVATELRDVTRRVEDHADAEIKGRITAFTSAQQFSVDGIAVDASNASFPEGTAGVVLGARVEVEGHSAAGVLVATKVSIETEAEARHGEFELHGAIDTLDTTAKTFTLRGLTVAYGAADVQFKNGSATNLAVGAQLEVKGVLSSDGTMVAATRIEFER